METRAVSLCNHCWQPYYAPQDAGDHFAYCPKCGIALTIRKEPPSLPRYDKQDYFRGPEYFTEDGIPRCSMYLGSRLPALRKGGLDKPRGNGQLLQIGPGIGQLTSVLLAWGWDVCCVEIGDWSSRYLTEAYPSATVYRADWAQWEPPQPFAAIVANHVLEHFPDAEEALQKMVSCLQEGGVLYIEVPAQLFDEGMSNEEAWPNGLHNRDHWWHFSERGLRTWFRAAGLVDICFCNTVREDGRLVDYHVVGTKP